MSSKKWENVSLMAKGEWDMACRMVNGEEVRQERQKKKQKKKQKKSLDCVSSVKLATHRFKGNPDKHELQFDKGSSLKLFEERKGREKKKKRKEKRKKKRRKEKADLRRL
jgi:hypothetical protein